MLTVTEAGLGFAVSPEGCRAIRELHDDTLRDGLRPDQRAEVMLTAVALMLAMDGDHQVRCAADELNEFITAQREVIESLIQGALG
jgi:hypothetical protein